MSFILYLTIGTSPIDIIWLFNNKEIKNSNAFKYVSKGDIHSLVIDEIFPEDAGIYICEAYNDFGDTDTCCKLKVKELPSLQSKPMPPTIQEKPTSLEVDEGSNVKFTCIINGNPIPSIEWEKDSRKVTSGARIKVVNKENHYTFEIPHALSTDAGSYTVIAKNSAGEAKCDFSLKVKQLEIAESNELQKLFTSKFGARRSVMNGEISQKPQFLTQLLNRTVKVGSCVVFDCRVIGVPVPQITWFLNSKEIKESKFFKMNYVNNKAELRIEEAYSEDEGEYECRATNKTGEMFSKAKLTIKKEAEKKLGLKSPTIESGPDSIAAVKGKPVTMKICFAGSPDPVVMWYKDSKELKGSFKMPIKTYKGISELTLNSAKPEDAGRYIAIVDNSHGSCKRSISLSIEDVPEPPAGKPSISDITEKSVTLSWSGPCYDGGAAITGYNVEICKVKNNIWKTVLASCHSTSCIIKNLEPRTEYMFRIRAENSHGLSVPGQQSNIVLTVKKSRDEVVGKQEESPKFVNIVPERDIKTHYSILEEVGKGRFGTVHRCVEKSSGKVCAAKFLQCPRGSDKDEALRELETMNELSHGALLRLVDAFEAPKEIIILTEYIPGGELFERVVADDFVLTEKDCIMFMRQICEGVQYMHSKSILHLDLKPENILCITKDSNQIKIIDFGLARKYDPKENIKIMFGTPEFVAPEVINFEPIGFSTDMWSTGVICYILLSGLSPFLGDNDQETFSNVTACDWDFEDETFLAISNSAKDFIERLLVKKKENRNTVQKCLEHRWLAQDARTMKSIKLSTDKHKKFLARRKWQKTGNAIRALGRMASLRNSISTALSSPSENNNLHHVISEIISVQKEKNVLAEETTNKEIELPNIEAQVQKSPRFLQEIIKEVDVVEGSAVKYQVKVSGTPEPDVDWYKDGELIQEDRRHKIEYEDDGIWSLIILEVEEDDEGDYECHARNPHGKASCKSELFVLVPGND